MSNALASIDEFVPVTPRGSTRFDMQNRGPLRPGKTERDHLSGAHARTAASKALRSLQNQRGHK